MRRALGAEQAQGLRPFSASTDFGTKGASFTYNTLLPQAGGLSVSEAAIYKYMDWLWYQFKSWLGLRTGRELFLGQPEAAR